MIPGGIKGGPFPFALPRGGKRVSPFVQAFKKDLGMKFSIANKARVLASVLFLIFLVAISKPRVDYFAVGMIFVLLGCAIRIWASGYIYKYKEEKRLAVNGPYQYTRNPLYFGSMLIGIGFCFLSGMLWTFFLFVVLYFLFYYPVIIQEERMMKDIFGEKYLVYYKNVPRFFPTYRSCSNRNSSSSFSWKMVMVNREFQQSGYILIMTGIIGVKFLWI